MAIPADELKNEDFDFGFPENDLDAVRQEIYGRLPVYGSYRGMYGGYTPGGYNPGTGTYEPYSPYYNPDLINGVATGQSYAQSIAGGIPMSQMIAPGVGYSLEQPGGYGASYYTSAPQFPTPGGEFTEYQGGMMPGESVEPLPQSVAVDPNAQISQAMGRISMPDFSQLRSLLPGGTGEVESLAGSIPQPNIQGLLDILKGQSGGQQNSSAMGGPSAVGGPSNPFYDLTGGNLPDYSLTGPFGPAGKPLNIVGGPSFGGNESGFAGGPSNPFYDLTGGNLPDYSLTGPFGPAGKPLNIVGGPSFGGNESGFAGGPSIPNNLPLPPMPPQLPQGGDMFAGGPSIPQLPLPPEAPQGGGLFPRIGAGIGALRGAQQSFDQYKEGLKNKALSGLFGPQIV